MNALDLRNQLMQLHAERALVPELDDQITALHHAYVGAAVTEIATLRVVFLRPPGGMRSAPCPTSSYITSTRPPSAAVFAAWRGFDSPLRHRSTASTCLAGGHALWWRVEATDPAHALVCFRGSWPARRPIEIREVQIP